MNTAAPARTRAVHRARCTQAEPVEEPAHDRRTGTVGEMARAVTDAQRPAGTCSENVLVFLNEVAEASNGIAESERDALLEAERAFTFS